MYLLLKDPITVHVQAQVAGPGGIKLVPGKVHTLEDSPYVRVLIKSGSVTLIDPPSLDLFYLERAGYELREGFSYPEPLEEEPVVEEAEKSVEEKAEKPVEAFLTRVPKKTSQVSEEEKNESSDEKTGSQNESV